VSLYYYTRIIYSILIKTRKINLIYQDRKHTFPALGVTISVAGNVLAPILVMLT
jgi:hypothetical protein